MSKAQKERLWYLNKYYARGGWHIAHDVGTKKSWAIFSRLLKDGLLEKDPEHDLYRCTDAGHTALRTLEPAW